MSNQQSPTTQQTSLPCLTPGSVLFGSSGSPLITVIPSQFILQISTAPSTGAAAAEATEDIAPTSTEGSTNDLAWGSRGRGQPCGQGRRRGQGNGNRGTRTCGCGSCGTGNRNNAPKKAHKLWTQTKNDNDKSELDLIVGWLMVEGNYQKWRSSEMSKRDVCKLVLIYLSQNGFEDQQRNWRGVEQQNGILSSQH
ncbi:hypothetical protein PCASD_15685 [Puccinia coronata f. sp. avenae]|uniref:Uncharacterized protein n=1 Tax=Puccinia coronata f. sp. avenae TaxID=200324 RepID=A0A2N5UDJ7_9BASI|nr:hypothetical protein PCASD_15685 [Puccinia coronata f. sp. avenae]